MTDDAGKNGEKGNQTLSIVAIAIGVLLLLGGVTFLLASSFALPENSPAYVSTAPLVQIAMALLVVVAGIAARKGHAYALPLLVVAIVVVLANMACLVLAFLPIILN